MRKIFIIGFLAFDFVLFAVIAAILLQPNEFRVERSIVVNAPPSEVFAQVNDFHNWSAWSPWAKLDPSMMQTYEGAPEGEGAVYFWSGNDDVGEGRMTILESKPDNLVKIELEFIKPWTATNTAVFIFEPEAGQTRVSWAMYGENGFMAKAFQIFMDMDSMVGGDFEKGLADLKATVEKAPAEQGQPSASEE
ncbi:MAG: SRPBCC family protein [Candidatus Hydrogenedentes bacterium]|nr:SRPBCC family protein [Candidatus Hydrogenedentota bacterium]